MTASWLLKTMAALCREHGLCKDTVVHGGYLCPEEETAIRLEHGELGETLQRVLAIVRIIDFIPKMMRLCRRNILNGRESDLRVF